jgi:hypothetical protein
MIIVELVSNVCITPFPEFKSKTKVIGIEPIM